MTDFDTLYQQLATNEHALVAVQACPSVAPGQAAKALAAVEAVRRRLRKARAKANRAYVAREAQESKVENDG